MIDDESKDDGAGCVGPGSPRAGNGRVCRQSGGAPTGASLNGKKKRKGGGGQELPLPPSPKPPKHRRKVGGSLPSMSGADSTCKTVGCFKKSRGATGKCRMHGGGTPCDTPGCNRYARLLGKCSVHGGVQLCSEEGCDRRARFFKKCTHHGGFVDCQEPKCTRRAVSKGRCAMHGGKEPCRHQGCARPGLKKQDGWCQIHVRRLAMYEAQRKRETEHHRLSKVTCTHFAADPAGTQCSEAAIIGFGGPFFCPLHLILSRCGATADCKALCLINGRCASHAGEEAGLIECQERTCTAMVAGGEETDGFCPKHTQGTHMCAYPLCTARSGVKGGLCKLHRLAHASDDVVGTSLAAASDLARPVLSASSSCTSLSSLTEASECGQDYREEACWHELGRQVRMSADLTFPVLARPLTIAAPSACPTDLTVAMDAMRLPSHLRHIGQPGPLFRSTSISYATNPATTAEAATSTPAAALYFGNAPLSLPSTPASMPAPAPGSSSNGQGTTCPQELLAYWHPFVSDSMLQAQGQDARPTKAVAWAGGGTQERAGAPRSLGLDGEGKGK